MVDGPTTTKPWPQWADAFLVEHLGLEEGDQTGYVLSASLNPGVLVYRAEDLANPTPFKFPTVLRAWPEKPVEEVVRHLRPEDGDQCEYELEPDPVKLPPFVAIHCRR